MVRAMQFAKSARHTHKSVKPTEMPVTTSPGPSKVDDTGGDGTEPTRMARIDARRHFPVTSRDPL